jgi:NAD+ kinase
MPTRERTIRKVLLIVNLAKDDARAVSEDIQRSLVGRGVETLVYAFQRDLQVEEVAGVDLAITLGGDGTLLYTASLLSAYGVPILAVNLGQVGFVTEISRDEWEDVYEKYECCSLGLSQRVMLDVQVRREGRVIHNGIALNDAVIGTSGISRLIQLRLYLANSYAGRYRADGLIVATPTGSTAYSMRAGGPILHPEMEAFLLNPICPYTLSNRPLVVPATEHIEIEVEETRRADVILSLDGQLACNLAPRDRVFYGVSDSKCLIIRSDKRNFYEVLRAKLHWAGEPNA